MGSFTGGEVTPRPFYVQIPLEEYEHLMSENKRLKEVLKRHGITLLNEDYIIAKLKEKK